MKRALFPVFTRHKHQPKRKSLLQLLAEGRTVSGGAPTIQDLIDRRAGLWEQMKTVLDGADSEGRGLSAEEAKKYDDLETDLDSLTRDIDRLQKHEARKAELEKVERTDPELVIPGGPEDTPQNVVEQYSTTFGSFLRGGMGDLEPEQRKILRAGFVDAKELRAQGVATGAAGGFLVPEDFRNKMVETMKFFGAVRQVAEVIETTTGADLPWPTNDDTANKGALVAESTQITEQDVTLGEDILKAYMYTSKIVRVSFQLLQDNAFNLETWLPKKLGERIGRIQNEHFTTGTGVSQPEGIQTNATVGKPGSAGQTTSVTYDDLIDLIHSVDVAYRNERSKFMFHDLSLAKARKLKDGQQRPLWEPSTQAGVPDALLGYGYVVNNDMPQMGASVKSVLFGDFEAGFVVRDVQGIQLLRLEERYADFLQVGFLSFARADSAQQDAGAYKAYQNSAT